MAYFDNAATTFPKPACVYQFMDEFYRTSGASSGRGDYQLAQNTGSLIAKTRKLIQQLLHCEAKQVVFTPTATIALNMIIQGLLQTNIHHVYITPFEHNAVTRILHAYAEQKKITIHTLPVLSDLSYDLATMRYLFDELPPDLVIVSHASNAFGLIAPVEQICALAKKYHAFTVVDMAQTAGLVDLNVGLTTIDFAVFAGHKTLYGPTGIAGFVMNPTVSLPTVLFGGTGFDSANQAMPATLPQKYEMGTLNTVGIAGLFASLQWITDLTIAKLWQVEQEHRQQLLTILQQYPFLKVFNNQERNYVGIVSVVMTGISSDSASQIFNQCKIAVRTGLQCAPFAHQFMGTYPAGTIRFSVSYFTTEQDFIELQQALDYIASEL